MTDLENNGQEMDLTELEVMEPKMMFYWESVHPATPKI